MFLFQVFVTALLLLLGHQQLVSGSNVVHPLVRFLVLNGTDGGCGCHGDHVHCTESEYEALCSCDTNGVMTCKELGEGCVCHGDHVDDCNDPEDEALCSCDANGVMMCNVNGDEQKHEKDCHCDGDVVHCSDAADESMCICFNDGRDLECADCACNGDVPQCIELEDEQFCTCTQSGTLSCNFEAKQSQQSESKPWGQVILASLVINVVTLMGVLVIAGDFLRKFFCPNQKMKKDSVLLWTNNIIPMFAAGALLATTFFLILPEALHTIEAAFGDPHAGHNHRYLQEDEAEKEGGEAAATWRYGTAILGGFLIPVSIHLLIPHHEDLLDKEDQVVASMLASEKDQVAENEAEAKLADETEQPYEMELEEEGSNMTPESNDETEEAEGDASLPAKEDPEEAAVITNAVEAGSDTNKERMLSTTTTYLTKNEDAMPEKTMQVQKGCCGNKDLDNVPLMASIFVGDFFHNFADGVFIGSAFLQCSRDLAITITIATIAHELPQELADYFLLVNQCGMTKWGALLLNFCCGLSVMIGALVVVGSDISSFGIGIILCISGGVYIHLAVAECYPVATKVQKNRRQKFYGVVSFVFGCVVIGLVLLNHQHC